MVYGRRSALSCVLYAGTKVLLGDDAWLLTELGNVVAYACRPSRQEDRRHGLLCTPQPATSVSASTVFRRPKWLALTALTALTAPTPPEELQP
jgi:hypothetical protein